MDKLTPQQAAEMISDILRHSPAILRKQQEMVAAQEKLRAAGIALAKGCMGGGPGLWARMAAEMSPIANGCYNAPPHAAEIDKARGDARYAGLDYAASWPTEKRFQKMVLHVGEGGDLMSGDWEPCDGSSQKLAETDLVVDSVRGGIEAERARILSAIQSLKPRIRPTHGDFARAWREQGALELYEKIVAAIEKGE